MLLNGHIPITDRRIVIMTAANRRRMMWFDMSRQTAGGNAGGGCIGHAFPAVTADTPEAVRADPEQSAFGATAKADTPARHRRQGTPSQSNGHPSAQNSTR